ncbi:hypothetical protein CROQUDRAFT_651230 [Cronartium quercuum f. sp. fusiforme G11]|uniref:Uncharacterized protein n=1 Tax=Cronartium quercuum f. sp. fusiforme G11 TaxID=708437 RepID=A0A9P6NVY9_9BASI|nr:hypothetical protein CROQUDRAFT_651230 [Cronartium quercuum f. sp. fusiforme G11]
MFGFSSTPSTTSTEPIPHPLTPISTYDTKLKAEIDHQQISSIISGNESVSCLTAFDNLLLCYSLSNQLKSIYRYGELNHTCSSKLDDFKFCLSLKALDKDKRAGLWHQRKAEKILNGPNSEDVWDRRSVNSVLLIEPFFV